MILIDMSPLKAGGGCQIALNFIECLRQNDEIDKSNLLILLPDTGPLSVLSKTTGFCNFITAPSGSLLKRTLFEYFKLKRIISNNHIETIFTFFGTGLPHPKKVRSIVCVAYPIVCYNESDFWKYLPFKERMKIKIKNWLRIKRLSKADLFLVETDIMKERLQKMLNRDESDFGILKPAPSAFVLEGNHSILSEILNPVFFFLSGLSPHKNLWRLPELSNELSKYLTNFKFVLSVNESNFVQELKDPKFIDLFIANRDKFDFVGSILPNQIDKYYRKVDFLVSLSDLESFSNNYMEAWKAGLPLIVSDRDFSRSICADSAFYIEPHNPKSASMAIANFIKDCDLINYKIDKGKELLKTLPSNTERTLKILKIITSM